MYTYSALSLLLINILPNALARSSSSMNLVISRVYSTQEILCILIIVLLVVLSFFELRVVVKTIVTSISLAILILHYYALFLVSQRVDLLILPFLVIEYTNYGSVFSIDYGQLMIILTLLIWRREIRSIIKRNMRERHVLVRETSAEDRGESR